MIKQLTLLLISLILIGCSDSRSFKFAFFSDTHVSEGGSGESDLIAAVQDVNQHSGIDFVIIAGDITEADIGNNLDKAKAALEKLDVPYYIIPGNHDTKWTESAGQKFFALWGDDKFVFEHGGLRFIGLHQGPEMRMADGHFAPQDLRWLDSTLQAMPHPDQPLIFVTHYPINPSVDNWYKFLEIIEDYNPRLVIHGHGHRNRQSDYYGIPGVMSRSTLRAGAENGGYNIVQVHTDSIYFREKVIGGEMKPAWCRLTLDRNNTVRAEEDLPDFSVNDNFPEIDVKWTYEAGFTVTASPAVYKEKVMVGDAAGTMHCLNLKSGEMLWQFKSKNRIYAGAAAAEDRTVFASADSNIYCLDVAKGKQLWKIKTGAPNVAVPLIEDGTVYIGSSDHIFRAIDLESGAIKWTFDEVKGYVESKPVIYQNKIFFTAWDESVYALNLDDGSLEWKWQGGRPGLLYSPAACRPVAAHGKLFIVAPDRVMTAINTETGKTIWRSDQFQVRESIGISEDQNQVFARCMQDTIVAVSAKADKYQKIWADHFAFGYDIAPSSVVAKSGTAFVSTKNGLIIAFDGSSGKLKWKYKLSNSLINTLHPLNSKLIVASGLNGKVYLLGKGTI